MSNHTPDIHQGYCRDGTAAELFKAASSILTNLNNCEERVLRIIAQEELFPITELRKATEVAKVFRDVFKGMYPWPFFDDTANSPVGQAIDGSMKRQRSFIPTSVRTI